MYGIKLRELNQAGKYLDKYLEALEVRGYSAWTLHNYRSALVKLFTGMDGVTIGYVAPKRRRDAIVRSRGVSARNRHFSETRNADLVTFLRCTGLRGQREAEPLKGTALRQQGGEYFILVKGKGGRIRLAPIVGTLQEIALVVSMMERAGEGKVLGKLPNACAPHRYRADYAARVYHLHARPLDQLQRKDKLICRGDMAGRVFDRRALMVTSEALGHSRVSVVVAHYSYKF